MDFDASQAASWVCDNGQTYRAVAPMRSNVYLIPTRWWTQYHPHEPLENWIGYDG